MKSMQAFWLPAAWRMLGFVGIGGALWLTIGPAVALAAALTGLMAASVLQWYFLWQLNTWLVQPDCGRMPRGCGIWSSVFLRLYRPRRDDERNRADMAEWLERFRQAINILPDGVLIMSDRLTLEWCNPAAERHLCLEPERDEGMRIANLIRHPAFIEYLLRGDFHAPLTLALKEHKLVARILPFENRRQFLVTHDINEAERIDTMRRDFVANASHELRTPLTVINGFLEIALTQPDLDRRTRLAHAQLLMEQGQRMQSLIEDMLTLTRLESTEHPLRAEPVNMKSLLEQLLRGAQALSRGQHRIELRVEAPDILGSSDELLCAFGNLVSNAVRYTPVPGVIHIAWRMAPAGPQLSVQDSGTGINPEHIARLTERFYRVNTNHSRATKGTGLGLAIVKHALGRHQATLAIESAPGRGSTFIAQFPSRAICDIARTA